MANPDDNSLPSISVLAADASVVDDVGFEDVLGFAKPYK